MKISKTHNVVPNLNKRYINMQVVMYIIIFLYIWCSTKTPTFIMNMWTNTIIEKLRANIILANTAYSGIYTGSF